MSKLLKGLPGVDGDGKGRAAGAPFHVAAQGFEGVCHHCDSRTVGGEVDYKGAQVSILL
jgi:hypothetical protein